MRLALDTKTGKLSIEGPVYMGDLYAAHAMLDEGFFKMARKEGSHLTKKLSQKDIDQFLDLINACNLESKTKEDADQ